MATIAAVLFLGTQAASADAPVPARHFPSWLQVISNKASLYAADSGVGRIGDLQRYAFTRVLAAGSDRLQVQAYDSNGQPGPTGWVDPDDVAPSASGIDWLVSSRATTLTRADGSTRSLDQFTPLQQTDGPMNDQVEVRAFRPDFSAVADQGWVPVGDTGPALAPQTRVPSATGDGFAGAAAPSSPETKETFLSAAERAAVAARAETGVPASVTVAQAILESDWGRSGLATGARNYFGMKAVGGLGNDGVVWLPTAEYGADGQEYQTVSPFRAYKTLMDSMLDHDQLLEHLSRYAPAMQAANDPRQFAELLSEAGYSTDPSYADKLIALMDTYGLYSLDS